MKYVCICMSPAIDACVSLDRAPRGAGEIFKGVRIVENVGGKAINVARWLAIRTAGRDGSAVVCCGLLGEDNAEPFAREFKKFGIEDRMTRVPGSTRRNEMIVWPGGSFKLNQTAFPSLPAECIGGIFSDFPEVAPGDVVVLSGSLPKCCGDDFYAKAVTAFRAKEAFVALDASGEAMRCALEAKPDLIKPNAEECEPLVGFVPVTPGEFRRATDMLRRHASHVVISDGANGAWFDGEFVAAPKVGCVDTTAAGDTLLAEYCLTREPKLAVAAGSAAVEMPGSNPPQVGRMMELAG